MENMNNKLRITYGDWSLGVAGEDFHCIFSYPKGGLDSLYTGGKEWLYRCARPTFWRALTDNDRGNNFPLRSGMWLSADQFIKTLGAWVKVDGKPIEIPTAPRNNQYTEKEYASEIEIRFVHETITVPAVRVEVIYHIDKSGKMRVRAIYHGEKDVPELPVFGMRFVMPTVAEGYSYKGLSGETYPDRKEGGEPGIYDIEGLPVTPYLMPQDCGMHMDTEWLEIRRKTVLDNTKKPEQETVLRLEQDGVPFAFSCLPYTAEELENATHQEELPYPRRTVLCVYGAVRGVGGIDSWGADVEEAYRISGEKEWETSFHVILGA